MQFTVVRDLVILRVNRRDQIGSLCRILDFEGYKKVFKTMTQAGASPRTANAKAKRAMTDGSVTHGIFFGNPSEDISKVRGFSESNGVRVSDLENRVLKFYERKGKRLPQRNYLVIYNGGDYSCLRHEVGHYLHEKSERYKNEYRALIAKIPFSARMKIYRYLVSEGYSRKNHEEFNSHAIESPTFLRRFGVGHMYDDFKSLFRKYLAQSPLRNSNLLSKLKYE